MDWHWETNQALCKGCKQRHGRHVTEAVPRTWCHMFNSSWANPLPTPDFDKPVVSHKNINKIILMIMILMMINRRQGGGRHGEVLSFESLPSNWSLGCECWGCDCHLFLLTEVHLPSHSWMYISLPISQQLDLSANQAPAWLPTAGKIKCTGWRGLEETLPELWGNGAQASWSTKSKEQGQAEDSQEREDDKLGN